MDTIVIESQPLIRLGMQRMLERMAGIGAVRVMEPAAIVSLQHTTEPAIVVFGMSADTADNWYLLRRLHHVMPSARILLLSDNMWLRIPETNTSCGVVEQLPKSASIERIEAVVYQMLGHDGFVPMPAARDGWRPAYQHHSALS
ncbi:response regulator [Cupriavidus sp. SW-Y-13]|uniref:response regulator n=1 Tax=Cupriavidus sp. SW-Y-13 TaxID=2653854 RepID=UPI0019230F90|nr:response regulator [Cupriavidus sp. SW-Y-13]